MTVVYTRTGTPNTTPVGMKRLMQGLVRQSTPQNGHEFGLVTTADEQAIGLQNSRLHLG